MREEPLYGAASGHGLPQTRGAWISVLTEQGASREEALDRVDAAIRDGRLVAAERRYTTPTALDREKRILQIEREGRGQLAPIASSDHVRWKLASSRLAHGQREAVDLIVSTPNRVVGVQGYAGTGKSQMLQRAKALVEDHGHQVIAVAPYASQVRALREHGVEARTLAAFLASRRVQLDEKAVLIIDEAGTVPARQMEEALKLAERAEARVVLLGDTRQTKAIEAGRPFDQLQSAGMATAQMQEIQRQKDPELRKADPRSRPTPDERSTARSGRTWGSPAAGRSTPCSSVVKRLRPSGRSRRTMPWATSSRSGTTPAIDGKPPG